MELAVADLMAQGVSRAVATAMLTAPGSPFAVGGELAENPAPSEPAPNVNAAPPAPPTVPMTVVACATHTAGNCPAACPDRLRANPTPVHVGFAIELHALQVAQAQAMERFAWACKAMGVDHDGKPLK